MEFSILFLHYVRRRNIFC